MNETVISGLHSLKATHNPSTKNNLRSNSSVKLHCDGEGRKQGNALNAHW
jgi:hypothetical protein